MKIDELEQIIKILKQNEVNEFEFDNDGVRIRLTRGTLAQPTAYGIPQHSHGAQQVNGFNVDIQPAITGFIPQAADTAPTLKPVEDTSHLFKVESPIVGTFYRKPSPDAPSFAVEGQTVTKGQSLCIIEAMKLMNEIESPISGKIEKILVNDAQVVEYGEVLFLINPNV